MPAQVQAQPGIAAIGGESEEMAKEILALRLRIEQVAEAATLEPELGSPSQSSARVHNGEGERHDIIL